MTGFDKFDKQNVVRLVPELTTGAAVLHGGYNFSLCDAASRHARTCNGLAAGAIVPTCVLVADPMDPESNPRFFGLPSYGVIYEHSATFSGTMLEAGAPLDR